MRHVRLQWISLLLNFYFIGLLLEFTIVQCNLTNSDLDEDQKLTSNVNNNGRSVSQPLKVSRDTEQSKSRRLSKRKDGNWRESQSSKLKTWQDWKYQAKLSQLSNSWLPRESVADKFPGNRRNAKIKNTRKPNIIFILTDDQDIELGSMDFMPKTRKILGQEGAHFPNAYVTTPMCCPSRSSILTGLYTHNHNVYTNNDNCSSPQWQRDHETRTFATYLQNVGYRTAFFGKYLNEYNGSYIPPGWREWSALIRNSRFYNYTLNVNGRKVRHGDDYKLDYYPDLIINDSLTFFRKSKQLFSNKPVMMMLSFPSPHGPEDSAPQFQHLFYNISTHRTPSWNYAPNPDKQWLLRHSPRMEKIHMDFTDLLHTKRLQTLQSVDIAVERLYQELKDLGELDNTYIFYTSDHGYHLGQFGLLKGKSMPFEFDIRVPFYVRGPKIPQGIRYKDIVLNLDLAPTFMDIAGVQVPDYIDGKSMLPLFGPVDVAANARRKKRKNWRESFLIERGKLAGDSDEEVKPMRRKKWLKLECQKNEYKSPCGPNQLWECFNDGKMPRIRKCRKSLNHNIYNNLDEICRCPVSRVFSPSNGNKMVKPKQLLTWDFMDTLDVDSIGRHVRKTFRPHYGTMSRSKRMLFENNMSFNIDGIYDLSRLLDSSYPVNGSRKSENGEVIQYHEKSGCFVLSNNSISCPQEVYNDKHAWKRGKETVDDTIRELQGTLDRLKFIRQHLKHRRPFDPNLARPACNCSERDLHWRHKFKRLRKLQERKKEKKLRRKWKFENTTCNIQKMNCFTHDNDHWKTPPLWTQGKFCFCQNANNNTFWCTRTINDTHNYLYCEFITGFITYYDLNKDPYQLNNAIYNLDWPDLRKLHQQLNDLRACSGFKQCNQRYRPS